VRSSSSAGRFQAGVTLCTGCHAIVERTQIVLGEMTPLLLVLWREKHPDGKEQLYLPLDSELPVEAEQIIDSGWD